MPCSKSAIRRSRAPEAAAVLLALTLAACGDATSRPHPRAYDEPEVTAPPPAKLAWDYAGGELTLREEGADVISLACFEGREMLVRVAQFSPVGSEERLSVGAGNTVLTLVASPDENNDPPTVKAVGKVNDDFLRAVTEGRKVAANYGAQDMGPLEGPPADMAARFAADCSG